MSKHDDPFKDEAFHEIDRLQRQMADELWRIVNPEVDPIRYEWVRNVDDSVDYGLFDNHPSILTTPLTEYAHTLSVRLAFLYEVLNPGWRRVDLTIDPGPDNEFYSANVQITPK